MLAQLVEDFVHLKRSGQRLDQHRRPDRPRVEPQPLLAEVEHVVPQPRLEVALHLREVEVGPAAALEQLEGVVEEVEAEVEERPGHGLTVDDQMLLGQVPAARADQQRRDLVVEPVLGAVGRGELDRPRDRVGEVELAGDHVRPQRRVGVLEVGHEPPGTRVERIDDHLAVGRPGDLDPPIGEVGRGRRHAPRVVLADRPRLVAEVERAAGVQPHLALGPGSQPLLSHRLEPLVQVGDEIDRIVGEDLAEAFRKRSGGLAADLDIPHRPLPFPAAPFPFIPVPSIDACSSSTGW